MASTRILNVPYCFTQRGIRRNHRNPDDFLMRGEVPVEIACIEAAEAPVMLTATLRAEGWQSASSDMALRHDGVSYLRAIDDLPGAPGGNPVPFTLDDFERMLRWECSPWAAVYGENDKPTSLLTNFNSDLRTYRDSRRTWLQPGELPTLETIGPTIRQWLDDAEPAARAQAIRAAADYVAIDGHMHRRVGTPVAVLTEKGFPYLLHADQIAEKETPYGRAANWMPIAYAHLLPTLSTHAKAGDFLCRVEAPLEQDDRRNLAFSIGFCARQCADYLAAAVPDMSEEAMAAYRTFRTGYAAAQGGDFEACLALRTAMHVMAESPSFSEASPTLAMRRLLVPKLEFLGAMARRSGLVLDADDEDALLRMAV